MRKCLNKAKAKKLEKRKHEEEMRLVNIIDEEDHEEEAGSRRNPHFLGPMDKIPSTINPNSTMGQGKKMRQPNISETLFKERTQCISTFS